MPSSTPSNRQRKSTSRGEQLAEYGRVALLATASAMILWFFMNAPEMAAAQSKMAMQQAGAIERENRSLCEKWGLRPGTHEHTLCTMDVQVLRRENEAQSVAPTVYSVYF